MISLLKTSRLSLIANQLNCSQFSTLDTAAKDSPILYSYNRGMGRVIVNKPPALNALDSKMIQLLNDQIPEWNKNPSLNFIVFQGAGGKAFCAGGDVKAFYDHKVSGDPSRLKLVDQFFRDEYTTDYGIATMKPVQISFWDGIVMGGGVGISSNSKIKIATENTMFAMPETKLGFFPDVGAGYFLSRLRNNLGFYLGLTGQRLKGEELVQVGLADYYMTREKLTNLDKELSQRSSDLKTLEDLKKVVKSYSQDVKPKYKYEDAVKEHFGKSTVSEIYKSLKNSQTDKEFCEGSLKLLDQASPISLRVTHELIKRGKNLSLAENFKMDYRVSTRFTYGKDFYEGIRTVLVEKGSKPTWSHKNVDDVTDKEVEEYFKPAEKELVL
jgi:enoyl-CoA hydratase/carnithine racemase